MRFNCGAKLVVGKDSGGHRRFAARRLGLRLGVADAGGGARLCRLFQRAGANTDRV